MSEIIIHPFPPVYDRNSRILILGSFPSVKSREEGFYYGHPRNRFWPLMERLYSCPLSNIEEKKEFLHSHGIALWDSIGSCCIKGSADSSIENALPNDISKLIAKTKIERIIANGGKAYDIYLHYIYPLTGLEAIRLPSTSPANASWSLYRLEKEWGRALQFG